MTSGTPSSATTSPFTLELLHLSDQEGAANALDDAPRLSAVLAALRADDAGDDGAADNSLTLSSGDGYIPGLFFNASVDVFGAGGVGDILIQNALGIDAFSFGNHEFDLGTGVVRGLIDGSATDLDLPGLAFGGTAFPYLSGNLDFSTDPELAGLVVPDGGTGVAGTITGSIVKVVGGEKIGIVGATTPSLPEISSPGGVTVLPEDFSAQPTPEQLDALAAVIQSDVDALLAANPDLNKVVLMAHMQQISIEQELAARLRDVDIIIAGGSDTRLFDADDRPRAGQSAQGVYPIGLTDAEGNPVAVVNTDGQYQYVGRLVIDFDAEGHLIADSYDPAESGAWAADEQGVADLDAEELVDPTVQAVTDLLREVIVARESNVFGVSTVFLNGERSGTGGAADPDGVRTQETNLGNLTADANLAEAKAVDATVTVSIKNGGGVRASIGQIVVPAGGTDAERLPNEAIAGVKPSGGISQTDVETALAFNNGLTLLTLSRAELVAVLEYGVSALPEVAGQFPQVGGIRFSFDADLPAGARIVSAAIVDEAGEIIDTLVEEGEIVGDPAGSVRVVTLNFMADGGDGYPFPTGPETNRVDLYDLDGDGTADNDLGGGATFVAEGTEQDALAEYLLANHGDDTPFAAEDTGPAGDERIQNLDFRNDTVLGEPAGPELVRIYTIQGASQISPQVLAAAGAATTRQFLQGLDGDTIVTAAAVATRGVVTALDTNGFYLQDATGDGNLATSDALFVFTGAAPDVAVGDDVAITGDVAEFFPGGAASGNLPTTQLTNVTALAVLSSGNALPEAQIIGQGGRMAPDANIDDDAFIAFNPAASGIDFFESMEGMRVTIEDAVAIQGTNGFGEIYVVADGGADASGLSERGTLNISEDDFNPERLQIDPDSGVLDVDPSGVDTGDRLGDVTGVMGYGFGNFEVIPTVDFTGQIQDGGLVAETTTIKGGARSMTVASYNVLNLDPNDADGDTDVLDFRFLSIASQIVNNLGTPDVIALQEVQDESGAEDDGSTSAAGTLQLLARAIDFVDNFALDGSLDYDFVDNTFIADNASGGEPGGNIRTAYLYNTDRVGLVEGSVGTIGSQEEGDAFAEARLPLVATFAFKGVEVTMVNNHFSSKGGSAPVMGTSQPFEERQEDPAVNGSLDQRQAQAAAVAGFVAERLAADPEANLIALGDLNEFEFISPVEGLAAAGLTNLTDRLPEDERYSYIFDGNSQQLDHILASGSLADRSRFDIVHVNSEFADSASRASDHDPLLARFCLGDQMFIA